MIGLAFCHGWSFDAQALAPLRAALLQRFPTAADAVFDLGFAGPARSPLLSPDRAWIAVGHSYGFAYLMQQAVPWKAAISLNGFRRFCRRPGQATGTPVRVLDAMRGHLADDPRATVRAFYERCGSARAVPDALDVPALQHHLLQLRDLDLAVPHCPTLALATADDAIVPRALAQACFEPSWCTLQEFPGDHERLLRESALGLPAMAAFIEKNCA